MRRFVAPAFFLFISFAASLAAQQPAASRGDLPAQAHA